MHQHAFNGFRKDLGEETVWELQDLGPIGVAYARIFRSDSHFHNHTWEYYYIVSGEGTAYMNGLEVKLKPGDCLTIPPQTQHYVVAPAGIELWVTTSPPWTQEDHILLKNK